MIVASLPDNEEDRIRKLQELGILDTIEEQSYDDITRLAAQLFDTPIALVSLVDRDRQWFKSHHGLDARETPRDIAFCSHAILEDEVFIIEDSRQDERFKDNPLVTGKPEVIFYAGAPLKIGENIRLGTLCVIANEPRTVTQEQKETLTALARQVVSLFTLGLLIKRLNRLSHAQEGFISVISDELKTPLTSIYGALSLLLNDSSLETSDDYKKFVEISHRNSEQLLSASNDILDIARMDTEDNPKDFQTIDYLSLLETAVDKNQDNAKKQGGTIVFDNPPATQPLIIDANEQQLQLLINKLISISLTISNHDKPIKLALEANDSEFKTSVIHHNADIAKDRLNGLFKNFDTLRNTSGERLSGTSLGLIICKQIIELHNGQIGFEPIGDDSSAFYFTLPRQHLNIKNAQ